ncbi:unannotated protein [freshwater metagenome]|uniref:Unannotated protein n=1 Tax=freshwater metagenome TaxID=449393 RepID=A0A6J7JU61_9ZZZZ
MVWRTDTLPPARMSTRSRWVWPPLMVRIEAPVTSPEPISPDLATSVITPPLMEPALPFATTMPGDETSVTSPPVAVTVSICSAGRPTFWM